jgi:phenylacetate-CoA ligase
MALQALQLRDLVRRDGIGVALFPTNFRLPRLLRFAERLPGVRTAIRAALIGPKMLIEARKTGVVHIFAASWGYFFLVVYPAVLAGRLLGKRVVLNYRGGEAQRFFARFGWAAGPAIRQVDAVTSPSHFLAGVLEGRFGVSVSIVPNILDFEKFRYRPRRTIEPRIIVTRHLEAPYDIDSVIRAFHIVKQRYPAARLWIAGTGKQEKHLRELTADLGLTDVEFLGHVPHKDLSALYDACDIYLNASRVDNFPGALLEASAAGLAMVSTAAGGIPFIYRHGETALLVESGDLLALAEAVHQVLEDPPRAMEMIEAARVTAQGCDWAAVRKALYRAYGWESKAEGNNEPVPCTGR